MAELADAPDLGSGGRPCRFDSCHPHGIRASEELGYLRSPGFLCLAAILTATGRTVEKSGC